MTDVPPATRAAHSTPIRAGTPLRPANNPYPATASTASTASTAEAASTATQPMGFALYVALDEQQAAADGVSLTDLVQALRETLAEHAPSSTNYATVAFAPSDAPGATIDLVRRALHEPGAEREQRIKTEQRAREEEAKHVGAKVEIDTSRKRVLVHGVNADFTYKEFELLQALVLREGRTVSREEIIEVLWHESSEERPHERTIDVHVRRLRQRLGEYADIVRTVRGIGYRFDRHADVRVVHGLGPSPDRF